MIFTNIDRTASVSDSEGSSDENKYCQVRIYTVTGNAESSSSDTGGDAGDETGDEGYVEY